MVVVHLRRGEETPPYERDGNQVIHSKEGWTKRRGISYPCTCELDGSACRACFPRYVVNGAMPYGVERELADEEAIERAKEEWKQR